MSDSKPAPPDCKAPFLCSPVTGLHVVLLGLSFLPCPMCVWSRASPWALPCLTECDPGCSGWAWGRPASRGPAVTHWPVLTERPAVGRGPAGRFSDQAAALPSDHRVSGSPRARDGTRSMGWKWPMAVHTETRGSPGDGGRGCVLGRLLRTGHVALKNKEGQGGGAGHKEDLSGWAVRQNWEPP